MPARWGVVISRGESHGQSLQNDQIKAVSRLLKTSGLAPCTRGDCGSHSNQQMAILLLLTIIL